MYPLRAHQYLTATDHYTAVSNTVSGTLAVDGLTVTFGAARRGLGSIPRRAGAYRIVSDSLVMPPPRGH